VAASSQWEYSYFFAEIDAPEAGLPDAGSMISGDVITADASRPCFEPLLQVGHVLSRCCETCLFAEWLLRTHEISHSGGVSPAQPGKSR
jgi:hypothetical protein